MSSELVREAIRRHRRYHNQLTGPGWAAGSIKDCPSRDCGVTVVFCQHPDKPWLAELTELYGRVCWHQGPCPMAPGAVREFWAWFPGSNCQVAVDRYQDHWVIRAHSASKRHSAGMEREPSAGDIRAELVLSGMLDA